MYPSIDNDRGIAAVRDALEARANKSPSTDCIIEGLEICLKCNNSKFGSQNLLQLNGTATGAPNSCSYADLAVFEQFRAIFLANVRTTLPISIVNWWVGFYIGERRIAFNESYTMF